MQPEAQQLLDQLTSMDDMFVKAQAIRTLTRQYQTPLKVISDKTQQKQSYICHIMRLTRLPEIIRDGYYSNMISISHLFIIARAKTEEKMMEIYEKVLSDNLNALQTDELVRESLYEVMSVGTQVPEEEKKAFIQTVTEKNNRIQPRVVQTRIRGKLILEMKGGFDETTPILTELMKIIAEHLSQKKPLVVGSKTDVVTLD